MFIFTNCIYFFLKGKELGGEARSAGMWKEGRWPREGGRDGWRERSATATGRASPGSLSFSKIPSVFSQAPSFAEMPLLFLWGFCCNRKQRFTEDGEPPMATRSRKCLSPTSGWLTGEVMVMVAMPTSHPRRWGHLRTAALTVSPSSCPLPPLLCIFFFFF